MPRLRCTDPTHERKSISNGNDKMSFRCVTCSRERSRRYRANNPDATQFRYRNRKAQAINRLLRSWR